MTITKPDIRPDVPFFSSGPSPKRPGWKIENLSNALLGRSHRSREGKERLQDILERNRSLLDLPDDYRIAIVPASDTGAMEMSMWSLLGPRGVDVLAWESFGQGWVTDLTKQLSLKDVRLLDAPYGELPDLESVDFKKDVVFLWNGTTSGACVPNGDWIPDDRAGLTICDATSAVFAMDIPWDKIDVLTWSWQKVLGGEAQHGMLVLSPRAVERLETYTPPWPLPKLFRMTKKGKLNEAMFKGATINTPSMLCVEDALDGLKWVESIGGLSAMIQRSKNNLKTVADWVQETDWIEFLTPDECTRSTTSICLKIIDPAFIAKSDDDQKAVLKKFACLLEDEKVAWDIINHRDAPASLRIWGGGMVESSNIKALLPWISWAFQKVNL